MGQQQRAAGQNGLKEAHTRLMFEWRMLKFVNKPSKCV